MTIRFSTGRCSVLVCAGFAALLSVACGDSSAGSGGDAAGGSSSGASAAGGTSAEGGGSTSNAQCTNDASTAENTAQVVDAANALLAELTSEQQAAVQYDLTVENARVWSNFPTTFVTRNGVPLRDMSAAAQSALVSLVDVAAGDTGSTLFSELRAADQYLTDAGNASATDYGENLYYVSFHGTPSTTSPWMLQVGGHHLAYNFTYNAPCTSATPLFDGAEPMDFTDASGTHAPIGAQRSTMSALTSAIASLDGAELSGAFGDLVNGPGGGMGSGGDTKYPDSLTYPTGTSGRGAAVASMSSDQKAQVKAAIEAWVTNVADPVSAALLAEYESDEALNETYVGFAGSSDLSTQGSYARIDGPRVWIEVTVQGGIVFQELHWHTIWRDKVADYGAEFE